MQNVMKRFLHVVFYICFSGWMIFSVITLYNEIPERLYLTEGEEQKLQLNIPVTGEFHEVDTREAVSNTNGESMLETDRVYSVTCKFLGIIPLKTITVSVVPEKTVIPAGTQIGIYAETDGLLVIGNGKVENSQGQNFEPALDKIQTGDYIIACNGENIDNKEEFVACLQKNKEQEATLVVIRNRKRLERQIIPVLAKDGVYRAGIWVRDDMAGIGTLTYITEEKNYGALGHPLNDASSEEVLHLKSGKLYKTMIHGITKGQIGTPGELSGSIHYTDASLLGNIESNDETGIKGMLTQVPQELVREKNVELCMKQNVKTGAAEIISSFTGQRETYKIEIKDLDYSGNAVNKGILFSVTDPKLLSSTGGIVQGMSGCPIIQNGKLIGAVTHVFISDPAKGYGIFADTMYEY